MYLALGRHTETGTYQIRQSRQDPATGHFIHHLVFDLGNDPTAHMERLGEHAIYFSTELEQAVNSHTDHDPSTLLEKLLWQFLPRTYREFFSRFHHSERYVPGPLSIYEKEQITVQVHIFDRRRLYYLHYRAVDQSRLFTLPDKACRPLLGQCRDEREYHFTRREQSLTPHEYRNYIYAIFNLKRYFTQSFATFLPEALPEDQVADHFVEALCELNRNSAFLAGEAASPHLYHHLVRYLIMFFDFIPSARSFEEEYVRRFMNSHRTFRWPERKPPVGEERISEIFGRSLTELHKLSRKELNRLYRQMAKKLHPDQGGDQTSFVELTEVYAHLLHKK